MASDSQNATSPPSDHPPSNTPSSSIWPPVYPPPGGAQFREYLETIDFYDDWDVDDMFARPRPVPGYESYPAAPADKSARTKEMDPLFYHPETLAELEHMDDSDSEDGAEFEIDSDYENDSDGENNPDADNEPAHASPAPRSRSSSPPLAPLRTKDFPPLHGTGLGKTTVLIRNKPRVAKPPSVAVEATYPNSTARTSPAVAYPSVAAYPSAPLLHLGTSSRRDSSNSGSLKPASARELDASLHTMGSTPVSPSGSFSSISAGSPTTHGSRPLDRGSSPYSPQQPSNFEFTGTGNSAANGSRRYSPQPGNSGFTNTGTVPNFGARTSMMSPPPNLPQPSNPNFANTGSVMSSGARNPMISPPPNPTTRGMGSLLAEFQRRVVADAAAARHLSRSNTRHSEVVNTGREPAFSESCPAAMNAPPGAQSYGPRAFHAHMTPVRTTSDMGPPPSSRPRDMERSNSTGNLSPLQIGGMMSPPQVPCPHVMERSSSTGNLSPSQIGGMMVLPSRPRPHGMGRSDFTGSLSPPDMGGMMGPPPTRQRLPGSFPHREQTPQLGQHFERGQVADYWPEPAVFPAAIRSMGEPGENLQTAGRLPQFGYRPHNMGLPSTEGAALHASPSDMGPPPKRQRQTGTFSGTRPHTERQYSNGPAEIDRQRHDQKRPHPAVVGEVRRMGERRFEERGSLGGQPGSRGGQDPESRKRHEDNLRKRTR
jgi:hypothetical protein